MAICVGGEVHEIGMRVVVDFFEIAGWDTYQLGVNAPGESVLRNSVEHCADPLLISDWTSHGRDVTD